MLVPVLATVAGFGPAQATEYTAEQAIARAKSRIADNAAGHRQYCTNKADDTQNPSASHDAYVAQCEAYGAKTEARRSCRGDAIDNGLADAARAAFTNACMTGAGTP